MSSPSILPGPIATTYSFRDLVGVLNSPLLDTPLQIVGGNIGDGTITIRMLTTRTEHDVAADGVVMVSYVPGANAEVTIEMLQTSYLHHALLALYNEITTNADAGDISNWASAVLTFRTTVDGSYHQLSGLSFQKIADKPYAAKGQMVTWTLMSAATVQQ
jgi:Protein of unknown function (DUF3277)